jgi:hypothetical protein
VRFKNLIPMMFLIIFLVTYLKIKKEKINDIQRYKAIHRVDKLYKKFSNYFIKLDEWEEKLIDGDLLSEYELKHVGEVATGIYGKLSPVVNALESLKERVERNTEYSYLNSLEKIKTTDTSVAKAKARDAINYLMDSAEKIMYFSQSRLKRETVEKTGKHVDYTGEVPNT